MAKRKKDEALTFEAALERLEQIVHDLEEGQLGLSESLQRYEEGVKYFKQCHEALEQAERKIELLTGVDAEGNPVTEPFGDEAMSLEQKQAARSRRRSQTDVELDAGPPDVDVDTQRGLF